MKAEVPTKLTENKANLNVTYASKSKKDTNILCRFSIDFNTFPALLSRCIN